MRPSIFSGSSDHGLVSSTLRCPPLAIFLRALAGLMSRATLVPVVQQSSICAFKSVLKVGCALGTYSAYFSRVNYRRIDLNVGFVVNAHSRYRGKSEVADARTSHPAGDLLFDGVFP